jgi:hypothetical protein
MNVIGNNFSTESTREHENLSGYLFVTPLERIVAP